MTATITVRCLACLGEVPAVLQRGGKTPRMLRHEAAGGPCPAIACEPIGAAAERARPRADLTQWAAMAQRIARPRQSSE